MHTRVIERDGRKIVLRTNRPLTDAEVEARLAELPVPPVPPAVGADGVAPPPPPAPVRRMTVIRREGGPNAPAAAADSNGDCATPAREFEAHERDGDTRKVIRLRICEAQTAKANAADAVRRARTRIEQDTRLSPAMRAEILRELDAEIASLATQGG